MPSPSQVLPGTAAPTLSECRETDSALSGRHRRPGWTRSAVSRFPDGTEPPCAVSIVTVGFVGSDRDRLNELFPGHHQAAKKVWNSGCWRPLKVYQSNRGTIIGGSLSTICREACLWRLAPRLSWAYQIPVGGARGPVGTGWSWDGWGNEFFHCVTTARVLRAPLGRDHGRDAAGPQGGFQAAPVSRHGNAGTTVPAQSPKPIR